MHNLRSIQQCEISGNFAAFIVYMFVLMGKN